MLHRSWVARALTLGAISLGLGAIATAPASARDTFNASADQLPTAHTVVPWGQGEGQVGMRPAQHELVADGASAVSVAPDGSLLLLDRFNGRVVRLDRNGQPVAQWRVANVEPDVEEISVASDGALAVYSPLRARVWIYDANQVVGQVAVPRGLRELLTISLGPSRQVVAHSAHQETYNLGSPAAPLSLPAVLHSKREGAFSLSDGSGLAARLDNKRLPELVVLDNSGERARVVRRYGIAPDSVLSARIVGLVRDIACVRLEHKMDGAGFHVRRSIVCLDASSGKVVFDRDLGAVSGPYVPRRSFAMGGSPLRLVFMQPADDGLHVTAWQLPNVAEEGAR